MVAGRRLGAAPARRPARDGRGGAAGARARRRRTRRVGAAADARPAGRGGVGARRAHGGVLRQRRRRLPSHAGRRGDPVRQLVASSSPSRGSPYVGAAGSPGRAVGDGARARGRRPHPRARPRRRGRGGAGARASATGSRSSPRPAWRPTPSPTADWAVGRPPRSSSPLLTFGLGAVGGAALLADPGRGGARRTDRPARLGRALRPRPHHDRRADVRLQRRGPAAPPDPDDDRPPADAGVRGRRGVVGA